MYIIFEEDQKRLELKEGRKILEASCKDSEITDIIINDELEIIGNNALMNNRIKKLNLKNVVYIGDSAFESNFISGILVIPESVEYIGSKAFANNDIKQVIITNKNTIIEQDAFYGNINLRKIAYKAEDKIKLQPKKKSFSLIPGKLKKNIV